MQVRLFSTIRHAAVRGLQSWSDSIIGIIYDTPFGGRARAAQVWNFHMLTPHFTLHQKYKMQNPHGRVLVISLQDLAVSMVVPQFDISQKSKMWNQHELVWCPKRSW